MNNLVETGDLGQPGAVVQQPAEEASKQQVVNVPVAQLDRMVALAIPSKSALATLNLAQVL